MKYYPIFFGIIALVLPACNNETTGTPEKTVEEIRLESTDDPMAIIRNPVTADGPVDTVNVARMTFVETDFEFGSVPEGTVVKHEFKFSNTGSVPLVINNARSTCGCTVPTWPKEPVSPGSEGIISIEFNSEGRPGRQEKPITITANTYPMDTRVFIRGNVDPKDSK